MPKPKPDPVSSATFVDPMVDYDWGRIQAEMIARDRAKMESDERIQTKALALKDARRRWWLGGMGYLAAAIAAISLIVFVVLATLANARETRADGLLRAREQTKRVEACTQLEAPIERQFCLIQIGVADPSDSR